MYLHVVVFSAGSDGGIVEARKKEACLSNEFSVGEHVHRQVSAPARPDSLMFTNIMDDLDQMTKDLESCLVEKGSSFSTISGVHISFAIIGIDFNGFTLLWPRTHVVARMMWV